MDSQSTNSKSISVLLSVMLEHMLLAQNHIMDTLPVENALLGAKK